MKQLRIKGRFESYSKVTKSGGKWRLPNGQFASKEVSEAAKTYQRRERARKAPRDERGKFLPKAEQQAIVKPQKDSETNEKLLAKKISKYWIIHVSLMVTKKEGENYVSYFSAKGWKTSLRKINIKEFYDDLLEKAQEADPEEAREQWINYERVADLFHRGNSEQKTGGYRFRAFITIRSEEKVLQTLNTIPAIFHSSGTVETELYG